MMKRTIRGEEQNEAKSTSSGSCRSMRPARSALISAVSMAYRKARVSTWKAKYSGMTVSEAKRLKALEDENAKLKRLLAEQMLDMAAMKELLSKKW
jgi:hypothetical protein